MRRDRTGEPIEDDDDDARSVTSRGPAGHGCRAGWLGDDDRPVPCLVCRPHLRRRFDSATSAHGAAR